MTDAGRIADGRRHRRRDAQQRALAHPLRAVRPGPVLVLDDLAHQLDAAGPWIVGIR